MATQADVRQIALALPETSEGNDGFSFSVLNKGKWKGIAWVWLERVEEGKARVPQPEVLGIRVANESEKQSLIAVDPAKFFTEPHYKGFPAVLVRLAKIGVDELTELITDAWRIQAPKALVREFDASR